MERLAGARSVPSKSTRILIVIFSVLLSFLALEGTYRLYKIWRYGMVDYPDVLTLGFYEIHPRYGYVARKLFHSDRSISPKIRNNPQLASSFGSLFTTNSWGYRGKEFSVKKNPDTYRIIALGGSTTMNMEVDDLDTWPAQLEQRLQNDPRFLKRHGVKRVEVINASNGGWKSREGLIRLQEEVRHFEPDLLLVDFNWNDFISGLGGNDPEAARIPKRKWFNYIKVFENLYIRYRVYQDSGEAYHKQRRLNLKRDKPWVNSFIRNLLAMRAIASEIHAEMVLVNLPGLCRKESLNSSEYKMIIDRTRVNPASFPFWVELKNFVSDLLRDIGRQQECQVIDVHQHFEAFSGAQRLALFTDEMHATAPGAEEIAKAVYGGLTQ